MKQIILDSNNNPDFIINNYPVFKVNNVEKIFIKDGDNTSLKWNEYEIFTTETPNIIEHCNYFNMDCYFNTAFAHFLGEGAVFLILYKQLKENIPNLKIYLQHFRSYKKAIFNAFDIDPNDIIYNIENNYNTFYFSERIAYNNKIFSKNYELYLNNFLYFLENKINPIEKDINLLHLTRGKKENFLPNDRNILNEENIIIFLKEKYESIIWNSDNATDNFIDQICLIKRAKIIILNYGSGFFVNALFLKNSHIIVFDDPGHLLQEYPYYKFLVDYINKNNTIDFIPHEKLMNLHYISGIIDKYI